MFEFINSEYVEFIRNFLVFCCYNEYYKLCYDRTKEFEQYGLIHGMKDVSIWNKIFMKYHLILKYYITISAHIQYRPPSRQLFVYPQKTFQEYIDGLVHIQSYGPYDYQQFIVSMRQETFKTNMITKYTLSESESAFKNNIIYLVQLRLYDTLKLEETFYFTEEEAEDKSWKSLLNYRPYLKYLECIYSKNSKNEGSNLEKQVLDIIHTTLYSGL